MQGARQVLGPSLFGFTPQNPGGTQTGMANGIQAAQISQTAGLAAPPWSPDNPLFWFAVLLGGTAAALLYSGRVKVGATAKAGPAKADASI